MIPFDTASLFVLACLTLAFAPGPDSLFVLLQSALYGKRTGILITLGLCTGLIAHTAAVSLGVAVIFQQYELAFTALKTVGALYLLYLAWQALSSNALSVDKTTDMDVTWYKLYRRGVIMNITNPKVAIFFLALLPQFADPARGSMAIQMLMLGGLFIVVTLFSFTLMAWFAGTLGRWLSRSHRAQIILSRITGLVFIGLALRLAFSQR